MKLRKRNGEILRSYCFTYWVETKNEQMQHTSSVHFRDSYLLMKRFSNIQVIYMYVRHESYDSQPFPLLNGFTAVGLGALLTSLKNPVKKKNE